MTKDRRRSGVGSPPVRWWASSPSAARVAAADDKAGSYLNLIRWTSPRTIKETFVPPKEHRYPFMG